MTDFVAQMSLSGRVALITGATGHLGAAIARTLAQLGADIALVDLDRKKVERLAADLASAYDTRTAAFAVDLEEFAACRALPERCVSELGGLNVIVNCAAMVGTSETQGWAVKFEDQSSGAWQRALAINLSAPFFLVQAATPYLRQAAGASVINIGSIYGISGPDWRLYENTDLGNPGAYAASKGGLLQLTRWLATTLAPEVRVNAVSPGGIARGQSAEFVARYTERTPLKRMGTEQDVVGAVAFLATDMSEYVTGQNIIVDGGWTAW